MKIGEFFHSGDVFARLLMFSSDFLLHDDCNDKPNMRSV